jgi:hypothetical protein
MGTPCPSAGKILILTRLARVIKLLADVMKAGALRLRPGAFIMV